MPTDPASRIEAALSTAERQVQRRFLQAVLSMQDVPRGFTYLVRQGRFDEAVKLAERLGLEIAGVSQSVFISNGQATARFLTPLVGVSVDFDAVNHRAVRWLSTRRDNIIREMSYQQAASTRAALAEGVAQGLNPRAQARLIRGSLGLTETQTRAVANYSRLLRQGSSEALTRGLRDRRFDRTVQAAVDGRRALSEAQIVQMTDRYRERYLRFRAETIARTESLASVHAGTKEMYEQSVDAGVLDEEGLTQEWVTARDERVRSSHESMNGQTSALDEPFESGAGALLRYPGDPEAPLEETIQCRCVVARTF